MQDSGFGVCRLSVVPVMQSPGWDAPLADELLFGEPYRTVDVNPGGWLRITCSDTHLMGSKDGCSTGHCGACMVIVSGKPTRACLVKMAKLGRARVEPLGLGARLRALCARAPHDARGRRVGRGPSAAPASARAPDGRGARAQGGRRDRASRPRGAARRRRFFPCRSGRRAG